MYPSASESCGELTEDFWSSLLRAATRRERGRIIERRVLTRGTLCELYGLRRFRSFDNKTHELNSIYVSSHAYLSVMVYVVAVDQAKRCERTRNSAHELTHTQFYLPQRTRNARGDTCSCCTYIAWIEFAATVRHCMGRDSRNGRASWLSTVVTVFCGSAHRVRLSLYNCKIN
ncbi:hypothetical protein PENSPDRAFT_229350 [Peniophora sp. CONT]|nr:hypothetical protein PENSPDRAFT_229350 [Peniophora sp. CONT]